MVALAANSENCTQCTTACLAVDQRPSVVPRKQILGEYRTIVRLGETGGLPFPNLHVAVARVHAVLSLLLPNHDLLISLCSSLRRPRAFSSACQPGGLSCCVSDVVMGSALRGPSSAQLFRTEDPNQIIHPGQALAGPRSLALGPDRKGKARYGDTENY